MSAVTFGAALAAARQSAGLTQAQLAEKSGVPYGSVVGYEQDYRSPSAAAFLALCRALDADPCDFADCRFETQERQSKKT